MYGEIEEQILAARQTAQDLETILMRLDLDLDSPRAGAAADNPHTLLVKNLRKQAEVITETVRSLHRYMSGD